MTHEHVHGCAQREIGRNSRKAIRPTTFKWLAGAGRLTMSFAAGHFLDRAMPASIVARVPPVYCIRSACSVSPSASLESPTGRPPSSARNQVL